MSLTAAESSGRDEAASHPRREQLTETNGGTGWLHTHVFANGQLLATYSSSDTWFELNDWLGTRRADVGVSGCETTWQSLPYGDGLTSSGNCSDTSELHFTGKERDEESGNDYFPARYYSSAMGRWMSPDPYMGSYDPSNPQSFNRYSYVMNDPLAYTDPSGRDPFIFTITTFCGGASGACAASLLNPVSIAIVGGIAAIAELGHIFGWWGSQFHGSLKPRPNAPKRCPSVPQHPNGASVDANIRATQAVYAADPSGKGAWIWWINQVKTNGPWDYKTVPPGYRAYDDFGNFNYGATGAVLTHSLPLLESGAVAARFMARPWAQLKHYGFENDPEKNEMIRQGMQYEENSCGNF